LSRTFVRSACPDLKSVDNPLEARQAASGRRASAPRSRSGPSGPRPRRRAAAAVHAAPFRSPAPDHGCPPPHLSLLPRPARRVHARPAPRSKRRVNDLGTKGGQAPPLTE
jgi:hypothetical protein